MNQKEVQKRYFKEFFTSMSVYIVVLIASAVTLNVTEFPKAAQIVIALLPVIPIIFVVLAISRALRDSDELQQRIQLQAIAFSAMLTGLLTFSYGFLENIGFPPFSAIWVLPAMFLFWGIGYGYFGRKYQ